MLNIITIIGARPQIIKAAALSRILRTSYSNEVFERILHTGQHYDTLMSDVFFGEMNIPIPTFNLNVGSGDQAWQIAHMIEGITNILKQEKPDGVVIYGDTNSTLAGALATCRLQIPLFHIEAGLRSHYMPMPEEQNRIVADHFANICFAPTQTAMQNLAREGLIHSPTQFGEQRKGREAILSGDIMLDNAIHYGAQAKHSTALSSLGLDGIPYMLATIHRDFNTDNTDKRDSLFASLDILSKHSGIPIIIPAHPRISQSLQHYIQSTHSHLRAIPPASYLQMLALEQGACMIITDSGGVQKEAYFFHKPCLVLRHETEWIEIVEQQAAILTDTESDSLIDAFERIQAAQPHYPPLFGDGHAAEIIAEHIINY